MSLFVGIQCDECDAEEQGPIDESPTTPANWFQVRVQQTDYHFCSSECLRKWAVNLGWRQKQKEEISEHKP